MHTATAIHEAAHAAIAEIHLGQRVAECSVNDDGSGGTRFEVSTAPPRESDAGDAAASDAAEVKRIKADVAAMDPDALLMLAADAIRRNMTDAEIRDLIIMRMVGRIAEMKVGPEQAAWLGAESDMRWERTLMLALRENEELQAANCRNLARGLVEMHWSAITALALKLMAKRKLSGDEVRAILRDSGALKDAA